MGAESGNCPDFWGVLELQSLAVEGRAGHPGLSFHLGSWRQGEQSSLEGEPCPSWSVCLRGWPSVFGGEGVLSRALLAVPRAMRCCPARCHASASRPTAPGKRLVLRSCCGDVTGPMGRPRTPWSWGGFAVGVATSAESLRGWAVVSCSVGLLRPLSAGL